MWLVLCGSKRPQCNGIPRHDLMCIANIAVSRQILRDAETTHVPHFGRWAAQLEKSQEVPHPYRKRSHLVSPCPKHIRCGRLYHSHTISFDWKVRCLVL